MCPYPPAPLYSHFLGSDIHPWEILINGERWAGKIRLIGFVDVFFLICYSADARFEKGIIVYSTQTPTPASSFLNSLLLIFDARER